MKINLICSKRILVQGDAICLHERFEDFVHHTLAERRDLRVRSLSRTRVGQVAGEITTSDIDPSVRSTLGAKTSTMKFGVLIGDTRTIG
jgi:hypothetical protein